MVKSQELSDYDENVDNPGTGVCWQTLISTHGEQAITTKMNLFSSHTCSLYIYRTALVNGTPHIPPFPAMLALWLPNLSTAINILVAKCLPQIWVQLYHWTSLLMTAINVSVAKYLPQTWIRLYQWTYLLSDQNLNLYPSQDLLLFISTCYIDYFLVSLAYFYHPAFPLTRTRLDSVIDELLVPIFWLNYASWSLTAFKYVWAQPGVEWKTLAVVDLFVEQSFVFMLTWITLHFVAALANRAFGWRQVRIVLEGIVRLRD